MIWAFLFIPLTTAAPSLPTPTPNSNFKSTTVDHVTFSPGYIKASEYLTKSINFTVDPCDDFFEFTCGNWIETHPIPNHLTSYSHFRILSEKVLNEMRELFESEVPSKSNSINVLKSLYRKCMDKETLNRIGAKEMLETIKGFGHWPMISNDMWDRKNFDLTNLLINVGQSRGVDVFISNYITVDSKNVSRRILEFDQGDVGLGDSTREYYLNDKYKDKISTYKQYLIQKAKLLTEDAELTVNEHTIELDIEEIINFEKQFAQIIVPDEERRNYTQLYNLRKISDLDKYMPLIDWNRYLRAGMPHAVHTYIDSDPDIIITDLAYLERLHALLRETDPRLISNYILLRYSATWGMELGEKYEDIAQEFNKKFYGKKEKAPRWKDCTSRVSNKMNYAVGSMYVRSAFNEESKNVTLDMIKDIQESFRILVINNDWMDNKTKEAALEKASEMLRQIAYPDFILDDQKLDEYYKGLSVNDIDSYSMMVEKLNRWELEFSFLELLKPVDRTEFGFNSAVVNAYYSASSNSIKFPAAILQAPFFDQTFPKALNYGAIGSIIGHEITHGFDDQGRQFDKIGNLREWWDADTMEKFIDRAQCIIDQYEEIEVPNTGLNVNGKLTQGENIADNGGIKQSFRAYKRYLEKHGEERRIPGLEEYTNEQMFFLGYGQVWCGHQTTDSIINLIISDPHAPQRYRVNQVLANQPEFAAAFECPIGSPMNPAKKCGVW